MEEEGQPYPPGGLQVEEKEGEQDAASILTLSDSDTEDEIEIAATILDNQNKRAREGLLIGHLLAPGPSTIDWASIERFQEENKSYYYYDPTAPITMEELMRRESSHHFEGRFRVTKEEFWFLYHALEIPASFTIHKKGTVQGALAFGMLLARLGTKAQIDPYHTKFFGMDETKFSSYYHKTLQWLHDRWCHVLQMDMTRVKACLRLWAEAIGRKIGLDSQEEFARFLCFAFIDGTFRRCCRANNWRQRSLYNGHHRGHGYIYQGVMCPSGIFEDFYGPLAGRHHDCDLLWDSEILDRIGAEGDFFSGGEPYYIYGDPAYPTTEVHLTRGWKGDNLPLDKALFNALFSKVRICVEWGFGVVTSMFPGLDDMNQQRSGMSAVGVQYKVSVLLANCRTCLRGGNIITDFFDDPQLPEPIKPPSLNVYLRKAPFPRKSHPSPFDISQIARLITTHRGLIHSTRIRGYKL